MTDIEKIKNQIQIYKREIQRKLIEANKKAADIDKLYEEIKKYKGIVQELEDKTKDSLQKELF